MTLKIEGDSNDYFGKGLSGAKLIIRPPKESRFLANENMIIGNVALYGATSGSCFINGKAGERFCVRNSGAVAVVEGVGDHGCEYMTGGEVVILGKIGRNFAAGMSGGIAYIYSENSIFENDNFNMEMIGLEDLKSNDLIRLNKLIQNHVLYTKSSIGKKIISNWNKSKKHFIKVMPTDYKAALELLANNKELNKNG